MALFKIPKDKREEGASATLTAEGKGWATKIVKIGGKKTIYAAPRLKNRLAFYSTRDFKMKVRKAFWRPTKWV